MRNTAVGLNFLDTYHRSGLYPMPLPLLIGSEGAGVAEAIGPQVKDLKAGDRVDYAGPIHALIFALTLVSPPRPLFRSS